MINLGPKIFNLSTLYRVSHEDFDSEALRALKSLCRDSCQVCDLSFENDTQAFRHWCSLKHAENSLKRSKEEPKEVVEVLKHAKTVDIFAPMERKVITSELSNRFSELLNTTLPPQPKKRGRPTGSKNRIRSETPLKRSRTKSQNRGTSVVPSTSRNSDERNTPEDPSMEDLLSAYRVVSSGLRRKNQFRPHSEKNLPLFKAFREFVIKYMKALLIAKKTHKTLVYSLFQVFKSLDIVISFEGLKKPCGICEVDFDLRHLLSENHIQKYRNEHHALPPELLTIKNSLSKPEILRQCNPKGCHPPAKKRKVTTS